MPGYLEDYGAGDAKREKTIKWIVFSVVGATVLGTILYFGFRDYPQEQRVKQFLEALRQKNYQSAYTMWGCTMEAQCRDYSYAKFLDDWGPTGSNTKVIGSSITESERCGTGFIAAIGEPRDDVALWVERETGVISFAPWRECPERKLRVIKWIKMKLGKT